MLRWLIVVVLGMVLMSGRSAWLRRFGFGRLPGEVECRAFGREWQLPIASTVVLSMLAALVARLL